MLISDQASSDLSYKTEQPIPPCCPTCGKKMRLTGVVPSCAGTIYDYVCNNDGDSLSWRPHQLKSPLAA